MKTLKISEFSEVLNGYQERKKYTLKDHFVYSIHPKDIEKDNIIINEENLEKYYVPKNMDKYQLQKNDVLFLHRLNFRAAYLPNEDFKEGKKYVPLQNLLIIRVDEGIVEKGYLSWFLNQDSIQNQINRRIEGTSLPYIGRKDVMDLKVEIPNLKEQRKIVELYNLRNKEKRLVIQLEKKKDILINQVLKNNLKD